MNIRQLQYVLGVAENRSVSRAAESMNISQSALSARIRELEEELGHRLFWRNPRGVKLTREGETLFPYVVDALQSFQKVRDVLAPAKARQAPISLGVTPTLGLMLMPLLVSNGGGSDETMRFIIRQNSGSRLLEMLAMRDIQAVITYNEDFDTTFPSFPLIMDNLVLVGPEELLRSSEIVDRTNLVRIPLVVEPKGHPMREKIDAYFSAGGLELDPVAEFEPFEARRALVLSGKACTITPRWLFDQDIDLNRISCRELATDALSLNMSLIMCNSLDKDVASLLLLRIIHLLDTIAVGQSTWTKRYLPPEL